MQAGSGKMLLIIHFTFVLFRNGDYYAVKLGIKHINTSITYARYLVPGLFFIAIYKDLCIQIDSRANY